jgi:glycosyltransferase involved in cell wall biosynthesis
MKEPNESLIVIANYKVCVMGDGFGVPPDQHEFLTSLAAMRGDVQVAAPVFDAVQRGQRKVFVDDHVSLVRLAGWRDEMPAWEKLAKYLCVLSRLRSIIYPQKVVYIYLPGWTGLLAGMLCIWRSVPYGCYVRGGVSREGKLAQHVYQRICRSARFIFCTGPGLTAQISALNPHVEPVRPAIALDAACFPQPLPRGDDGPASLLFVGQLAPSKGIADFIRLVGALHKQGHAVKGKIAGAGSDRDEAAFKKMAADAGLLEHLQFTGYVADQRMLKALYEEATLFVFPSQYNEGFPRVIYEAMLSGLPVVTYDCDFGRGFLVDGENCVLVSTGSVEMLAMKTKEILASSEKRFQIAIRGYRDVLGYLENTGQKTHDKQLFSAISDLP